MIYLNAASHGLPDARTHEAVAIYVKREAEVGPIVAAREAADDIAAARTKAADLIGAMPEETALVPTTTAGWSAAVATLPLSGKRILVAQDEWGANLEALRRLPNSRQMRQDVLAVTADGDLDLEALRAALDDDVAAICVPMVSSLMGRRYPVEEIGRLARPYTCFFVVDAAQAVGQTDVNVKEIGCDVLAATARKWLRAPRGIAILYAASDTLARMTPVLAPDYASMHWRPDSKDFSDTESASRFETLDYSPALRVGLGAALEVAAADGVTRIAGKIDALARHARKRGAKTGLALASPGEPQSGITSFLLPARAAQEIQQRLAARDIVVKFPDHANEPLREPPANDAVLMRIAPHIYNQASDIDALFDEIDRCV